MSNDPQMRSPERADALLAVEDMNLTALEHIDEVIAAMQAMRVRVLAAAAERALESARELHCSQDLSIRSTATEIAAALRTSSRTVERQLHDALSLTRHWAPVVDAWAEGRITRGHVAVITEAGAPLAEPAQREAFAASMIATAESTSPGTLKVTARREADRLLTTPLTVRHRAARDERRVTVHDGDDGMSMLAMTIPTVLAHGILDRLTQGAKRRDADDPRTIQQWRADAACDLLLTGETSTSGLAGIRAEVTVVIPATALTADGDDAEASQLPGRALVDHDTARTLASDTPSWTRLFTDPLRGHAVATDSYTPTAGMRRLLRHRDRTCRMPGCGLGARRCDIDHTLDHALGGPTTLDNLAHFCRRDHVLKHETPWRVEQLGGGRLRFTSPLGRTYLDEPPPLGPTFRDRDGPPRAPADDPAVTPF